MRGFIVGTVALIALQVLTDTRGGGPDVAAGLLGWATTGLRKLSDPTVPGLPSRAAKTKTTSTKPGTSQA